MKNGRLVARPSRSGRDGRDALPIFGRRIYPHPKKPFDRQTLLPGRHPARPSFDGSPPFGASRDPCDGGGASGHGRVLGVNPGSLLWAGQNLASAPLRPPPRHSSGGGFGASLRSLLGGGGPPSGPGGPSQPSPSACLSLFFCTLCRTAVTGRDTLTGFDYRIRMTSKPEAEHRRILDNLGIKILLLRIVSRFRPQK